MRTIRDCNVCVVGGAGFLGSHLVEFLIQDRGCKVTVVDNLCVGRREFVHPQADFHHADITLSEHHLQRLFHSKFIKHVFNYAAYPYIPDSFARPVHVFMVNAVGAMHVINAAQEAGCESILQVSSAEIYGDGAWIEDFDTTDIIEAKQRLDESCPVVPHSSYGASKVAVDGFVQAAWKERQTPCIALRQFNCVGERETHPYVVPEIISQLASQQKRILAYLKATVKLGNNSFRDFLYAGDQARIAVELLERGQFGEVYNLGSESGIRIYDLAKLIGKLMGVAEVQVQEDESRKRPWEIWHLQSCNGKLWDVLERCPDWKGNRMLTSLEEALKRTIKWFESNGRRWPWE